MTIYYVSTTGNDNGTGSASSPFRSINYAVNYSGLKPGDTVIVKDGTYTERVEMHKDGTANAYITLKAEHPGGALIRPPSGTYSTVIMRADYNVIEGFDVVGGSGVGIDAEGVHHVVIRNNKAHDSGGSGISAYKSEFVTIEGNIAYGNAKTNGYHMSGISVAVAENVSGDTTTTGYRIIVRNNISYDNREVNTGSEHTDGNGIIIDWFNQPWANSDGTQRPYKFPTLVDNNLVYNNGGKGIQVTWSDYVTVTNNTAYHNNQDNGIKGTWRAEINNQESANNTYANNIAVANPAYNSNNVALGIYSGGNASSDNVVTKNNLTFNGTPGQTSAFSDRAPITAANGNQLGVDPKFVQAGVNFNLLPDSPAINKGTSQFGLGTSDVDGSIRVVNGTVDIGAQEYGGTPTTPTPAPSQTQPVSETTTTPTTPVVTKVGTGSDKLVLKISQDAFQGDSQYTVSVDGKQVGGTFTAKALHSSDAVDTLEISGEWGLGNHSVEVKLVNDHYVAGQGDRNVYVESATYNGTSVLSQEMGVVMGDSPRSFTLTDTTPVPGSATLTPAPTPTQPVSETPTFSGATYSGTTGNDTIIGNASANTIYGRGGDDVVKSGYGADVIIGGTGKDQMWGGNGSDVFVFKTVSEIKGDLIMDFAYGQDKIDLRTIDANTSRSGNQAFAFDGVKGAAFQGQSGHVWLTEDTSAGVTHVYSKVGTQTSDIMLKGLSLGLTHTDFLL